MIVRILEEGQYDLSDEHLEGLNALDTELVVAVNADDEASFEAALARLLTEVRSLGAPVPDDYLGASDLVLPAADSTIHDVRALLGDEGLIPG